MHLDELVTKQDLHQLERAFREIIDSRIPEGFVPGRKWLRSGEICKWLGISASTLQNMRDSGSIPFTMLDKTYLYPYEEIRKRLEKNLRK